MRQNDKRLLAVGEISKESGLSLWNLNALKEKPRFSKLKGHIKNVDLWEELLLALSKGGGLSVHDLNDPRSQPTLLSKRDDGQALDVHWIGGRALAAFSNKVALINVENGHAEYLNVPALRDPAVSPLGPHVAVAGPSSCMLWDLRRSVTAVEMAWPGGFTCRTLARLVSDHTLVAGGFGQVPLHYMDLRMPSNLPTYPVPRLPSSGLLEIQRLLTGNPCVSAQFQDRSLATWHLDTGTLLGWWPSSRCLSIPSGTAAIAWPGIAAADDGHAYVALPGKRAVGGSGTSAPMMRQRKEGLKGGKGKEGGQVKMQGPKAAPSKAPRKDSQKSQETEAPREEESQRSQKLRTSEDVYHRILHDSRFDPKEVSIGYEDRFLGPMEVKLLDFQPGGDIPLHRIYYFRRGAEVLWDRKHRLDRIFNAEAAEAAPETVEAIQKARRTAEKIEQGIIKVRGRRGSNKVTPKEEAGMKYYRDEGCWVQAPATHFVQLTELKVLTLNVLFELFGDVKTHMEVRMAHMFQELERAQADILLLQEVTPSFVQTILAQHWVRDHYWSSCGDIDTASVNPSGQLTLSRLPMRSVVCARISQHKTVILATMSLSFRSKEVAVVIANLHLTADLNDASGTRRNHRVEQLQTCEALINDRLQPGDLGLIAGDFNDSAPAISSNFIDVWDRDEGYTFDPRVNTVAQHVVAAVGGCKDPRRIDRIYVGSGSWQFHAELFATEPFRLEDASKPDQEDQAWYISDHFGVLCRFWCEDSLGDTSNGDEQVLLQKPAAVLESNVLRAITLQDIESVSVELFLLGSAALGISDSGSDVDVLACSSSISSTKFFDLASEALQQHGIGPVDRAMDATVPLLKFQAGDVHIEVQFTELSAEQIAELRCSHTNAATDPVIANAAANAAFKSLEAILFTQSPQCQVGLAAALDAWALSRQLRRRFEHFRALTVEVKHWARHRQLLGTSFGFPGGFAWALLASKEVLGSSEDILLLALIACEMALKIMWHSLF
ncbi:unnamed protein product [Durusdinium trenchii]|uniref:Endonuclease/exonuclease/phosphatase domain-containing protein n=1 Tax=Durusdinium trenchii TaxID=1381693 RepID=A0ABP0M4V7_9DINO